MTWIAFKDRLPEKGDLFFMANAEEVWDEVEEWTGEEPGCGWTHWLKIERPDHTPLPELPGDYKWVGKTIVGMGRTYSTGLVLGEGKGVYVYSHNYPNQPFAIPFWIFGILKNV